MSDSTVRAAAALEPPLPGLRTALAPPTLNPSKGVITEFLEWFGDLGIFFWRVLRAAVTPPFEFRELFRQLDEVGSKSLPLVALAGAAIGVVLSMETRYSLTRFGAKSLLPAAIAFSVIHDIGPIITGLVASGRVGAGIGAELASMKVSEQVDAIEASAVNPYRLLASTRILACIIMLPLLTLAADFCALLMGWVAMTLVEPISLHQFVNSGFKGTGFNDFLPPTFKTAVFGLIIGLTACFQGMRTKGGAEGVGRAATSSVVLSSLFVILVDVVLVKVIIILFP
jgi:phospholipid/cholesterol/gamma-HCH transport system permease protein